MVLLMAFVPSDFPPRKLAGVGPALVHNLLARFFKVLLQTIRFAAATVRAGLAVPVGSRVEEDAPSLRNLEAAIDYAASLIPYVEGSLRSISVGRLVLLD
jgi:hypothetical protein